MRKLIALAVAALFALMAYLQINDPDPVYWVTVYLAVAVVTLSRTHGRLSKPGFYLATGLVIAGLLMSAAGFLAYLMSDDLAALSGEMLERKPYVESAREFLGLVIATAALVFYRPVRDGPADRGSLGPS